MRLLHAMMGSGSTKNLQIVSSVLVDLDIATALIRFAEGGREGAAQGRGAGKNGYELIALATHGRSGPARWMMVNTAERLLWETRLPLLLVRPGLHEADRFQYKAERG